MTDQHPEQQPDSEQMDQAEEHGMTGYGDPSVTELRTEPKDDL